MNKFLRPSNFNAFCCHKNWKGGQVLGFLWDGALFLYMNRLKILIQLLDGFPTPFKVIDNAHIWLHGIKALENDQHLFLGMLI